MMNHSETITKTFTSKRQMVEFVHFLDMDEILIQREGDAWNVLYNANKTTLDLPTEDYSEVVNTE